VILAIQSSREHLEHLEHPEDLGRLLRRLTLPGLGDQARRWRLHSGPGRLWSLGDLLDPGAQMVRGYRGSPGSPPTLASLVYLETLGSLRCP